MTRDKYLFDVEEVEKKCFLLYACFEASERIHRFCDTLQEFNIPKVSVFEPGIVTGYLIYIAIHLRMMDDAMRAHQRDHHMPPFAVGSLTEGVNEKQLDLREACNKIIHAKSVKVAEVSASGVEQLTKTIQLSGTKGKDLWNAAIEIENFTKAALFMVNRYDEDWDVSAYRNDAVGS